MASSVGFKSSVPPFEEANFNGWVRLFRAYLMRHEGLNETLDDSSDEEDETEMTKAESKILKKFKKFKKVNKQKVYSYLMEAAAANTTAKTIATAATMQIGEPKILLKALEARFAVKRALTFQQTLKSFHNMIMTQEESGAQFVDRVKSKISELCYFKDEAPPTDSTTLAILTEGIKVKFPMLYNNLVVSAIRLEDAYELISNYVLSASVENSVSVIGEKGNEVVTDAHAVANVIEENKRLKKNLKRFKKLKKKRQINNSLSEIECFKCGQTGHKKFQCTNQYKKKSKLSNKQGDERNKKRLEWANVVHEEDVANVIFEEEASVVTTNGDFILIDSGANRFIVRDSNCLSNLVKSSSVMNLAGTEAGLLVQGVGTMGCFKNVKWCPKARHDLVSVSALYDVLHCRTVFDDADGTPIKIISNSDNVVLFSGGLKINGLYYCDFNVVKKLSDLYLTKYDIANYSSFEANIASSAPDDKLLLWHNRSGHLNYSTLRECVKSELLINTGVNCKDIRESKKKSRPVCDVCARSKGTRTSFKPSHNIRGKLFGDYISVDIASYSVPSRDGYIYVLTFTDHASKKSKSYPLINRTGDTILFCLRDYIQTELVTRDVKMRHYHADGGGELICKLVLTELKSRGVTYSWTPPDTPELNAVSERKFRTLFERAQSMLLGAGLPVVFWWDAYEASEYITNCLPTKTSKGYISPEEFVSGQVPDVSHWRIWGCKAYVKIPRSYQRKDFSSKVMSGFLVGYSRTPIGYKVFVPELNDVITTVHVIFNEIIPDYTAEYYQELSRLTVKEEERPAVIEDFHHLIGEEYFDDENLVRYRNNRLKVIDGYIVMYRCPILASGAIGSEESAPIHIADVVRMMGTPPSEEQLRLSRERQELAKELAARKRVTDSLANSASSHKRPRAVMKQPLLAQDGSNQLDTADKQRAARGPKELRAWLRDSRLVDQQCSEDLTNSPDREKDRVATSPPMTRSSAGRPFDEKASAASFSPCEGVDSAVGGGELGKEPVVFVSHKWSARQRKARVPTNVSKLGDVASLLVEEEREEEPASFAEANQSEKWRISMDDERRALRKRGCWRVVDTPQGVSVIKCKYVYRIKRDFSGRIRKRKSRLVIQGFRQEEGRDYNETFAPVAKANTFRFMMALAQVLKLDVHQLDVDSAFLYADVKEDIYMSPPPDMKLPIGKSLKLLKNLYGLKQAPRNWYKNIEEFVKSLGFKQTVSDNCLFVRKTTTEITLLSLYVDDILIASNQPEQIAELKRQFTSRYEMKDLGEVNNYLGMRVSRTAEGIKIDQEAYADDILRRFESLLQGAQNKSYNTPMERDLKLSKKDFSEMTSDQIELVRDFPYQSVIGALLYLSIHTRPDLAYVVNYLSRFNHQPTFKACKALIRVLLYLRGTKNKGLLFDGDDLNLTCLSDSDWAGDVDTRKSTSGYVLFGAGAPIAWMSKLQPVIAVSSMEAEYIAAFYAMQEIIWIKGLMSEIGFNYSDPIVLLIDNQSAIKLATNPVYHKRSKHIDIKYHWIREKVAIKDLVKIKYVKSADNTADIMTKALLSELHDKHSRYLVV